MIPLAKVKLIVDTYETLEKELASGNIDKKDFVKKSKEYSSIGEVIEHAKGYVALGETSVLIAVACKHRKEVYEVSRFIIEEIKKRTPIWKKEHYEGKETEWLKGSPVVKQ